MPVVGTSNGLQTTLPARWGWRQRLKNTFLYVAIRAGFFVVRWTPLALARVAARGLALLAWWVAAAERRKTLTHLAFAFPDWSDTQRRRIAKRCFAHLAICGVEAAHVDRLARSIPMTEEQRALFDEVLAAGKGAVAVTGHIGNWELLAQVVAAHYPLTTFAKPLYDPRLTRWVDRLRTRGGLSVIWRGDENATRKTLQVFRDQGILAALIDQSTNVQGVLVPFFGHPAHTPSAAARLALHNGTPVIVAWIHRRGARHELHFEPIEVSSTGDRDADVEVLTARLTACLERAIRQAPEQWVWMHERWKRSQE